MKKIFAVIVMIFCIAQPCSGAPCYGTKMPKKKQLFIGTQTHWVLRRYLEKEYGKMRSLQHFLLITYGITDWFSLDLKGGAGYIKYHPITSDEIDYPSHFAGGYGFRIRLFEGEKTKMVFGFQHISIHPDDAIINDVKHEGVLDDWQYSLLVSYAFSRITYYVGTRWSRMDHIHWINESRKRERSDLTKSVGIIAGVDIPLTERTWINIEGSLLDSESVALSFNMAF